MSKNNLKIQKISKKLSYKKIVLYYFLLISIILLVVFLFPILMLRKSSTHLIESKGSLDATQSWVNEFNYYLKWYHFDYVERTDNNVVDSLYLYTYFRENSSIFKLFYFPSIDFMLSENLDVEISPPTVEVKDEKFPLGEHYELQKGQPEKYIYKNLKLLSNNYVIPKVSPTFEHKHTVAIGTMNRTDLNNQLIAELDKVLTSDFENELLDDFSDVAIKNLKKINIVNFTFNTKQGDVLVAGALKVVNKSCSEKLTVDLIYNKETNKYSLPGLATISLKDCSVYAPVVYTPIISTPVEVLTCTDCQFSPVDKTTALPDSYIPNLVATNLPGGGMVTPSTAEALRNLANEVTNRGMSLYVTSAYRSYTQQQATFNYWVNTELNKGATREQAGIRANIYSALPGHSEHQLGTTLDVRCNGCDAFSKNSDLPFYKFLQEHAHEYGFILSYPQGKQYLTGYTYEPWHIRYIGIDLATELFSRDYLNTGNQYYLASFLREKSLY